MVEDLTFVRGGYRALHFLPVETVECKDGADVDRPRQKGHAANLVLCSNATNRPGSHEHNAWHALPCAATMR